MTEQKNKKYKNSRSVKSKNNTKQTTAATTAKQKEVKVKISEKTK